MLVGPTIAPSAAVSAPSRTEAAAPPLPAVAVAPSSSQPQTLRAAVPVTAGSPRQALDDARQRLGVSPPQARDREARRESAANAYAEQARMKAGIGHHGEPPRTVGVLLDAMA